METCIKLTVLENTSIIYTCMMIRDLKNQSSGFILEYRILSKEPNIDSILTTFKMLIININKE